VRKVNYSLYRERQARYIYRRSLSGKPVDRTACIDAARFFIFKEANRAARPWEAFFALARARWLLSLAGEDMPFSGRTVEDIRTRAQKWFSERFPERR